MGKKNFRSWYRRTFDVPTEWNPNNRVLLNFGAVDYETTVYINGQMATKHEGGYWAFEVDITDYLSKNGTNELYVDCTFHYPELTSIAGSSMFGIQRIWTLRDLQTASRYSIRNTFGIRLAAVSGRRYGSSQLPRSE